MKTPEKALLQEPPRKTACHRRGDSCCRRASIIPRGDETRVLRQALTFNGCVVLNGCASPSAMRCLVICSDLVSEVQLGKLALKGAMQL